MTEFDEREQAFERKFELDEELKFKTSVRTVYLFGLWVAEQLGLKKIEAEDYAREMVDGMLIHPQHERTLGGAEKDLQDKKVPLSRHRLEKEFESFHGIAAQQIKSGT